MQKPMVILLVCFLLCLIFQSHNKFYTNAQNYLTISADLSNIEVVFTPAEDRWDNGGVMPKSLVLVDDIYHMIYDGTPISTSNERPPTSIGYAISLDGKTWERVGIKPILTASDVPFTEYSVQAGSLFMDDERWLLIFTAIGAPDFSGSAIGLATAESIQGPWISEEDPILERSPADWDSNLIFQSSVASIDNGWVFFYTGFARNTRAGYIGLATSTDGSMWSKNSVLDSLTIVDSMPITFDPLSARDLWDGGERIRPIILRVDQHWLMVYQGLASDFSESSLGYAVSDDGLTWRVGGNEPLIPVEAVPHAAFLSNPVLLLDANDDLWLYFSAIHDDETPIQIYRVPLMIN